MLSDDFFLFVLIASFRPFSHQVEVCTLLYSSMKCIFVLQFCNLAGANHHSTFLLLQDLMTIQLPK